MACHDMEDRILEYLDGALPAGERTHLEAHLAGCPACRAFANQLAELDAALARALTAPALSKGFQARLWRRLDAESGTLTEPERALRRNELQAEFKAGMAELPGKVRWLPRLLDGAGYLTGAVLVAVLAPGLFSGLTGLTAGLVPGVSGQRLVTSFVAGGLCLLAGLVLAYRHPLRRLALVG